ncbi:unnamed protein product [Angiostrongylus costaricensis]|uniref:Endo/exonuclease/phosphatase domain-containing protein n=1 Tax=Angiostrongylus costaricensis TaxID=334426 RepID=A0A0R3PYI6_ANGCS|nr:unnamed protein product [Angiostrongylus costaricensis]
MPKSKRTEVTNYTYNAHTLASKFSVEDLIVQARRTRCDIIGLAETRRRHPFDAVYDTEEELFLGTRHSRGVGGIGGQHEFVQERRFIRTTYNPNRTFTIKNMWINTGFVYFRRLCANVKLRRRRSHDVVCGLGEVLQRRPYILQGSLEISVLKLDPKTSVCRNTQAETSEYNHTSCRMSTSNLARNLHSPFRVGMANSTVSDMSSTVSKQFSGLTWRIRKRSRVKSDLVFAPAREVTLGNRGKDYITAHFETTHVAENDKTAASPLDFFRYFDKRSKEKVIENFTPSENL